MKLAVRPLNQLWRKARKFFAISTSRYLSNHPVFKHHSLPSKKTSNSFLPEDVFSVISHEIANSLTILLNTSALLNHSFEHKDFDNSRAAEIISQQVFRLQQTINSCRLFLLPNEKPELELCSLKEIIEEASSSIKNSFPDIEFCFYYPYSDSFNCLGHSSLIFQVFVNLFHNSIKHSSYNKKTVIIISFEKSSDHIWIRCEDNGPGIFFSDTSTIFNKSVSSSPSNSGMGLFIVKRIMNTLSGTVTVKKSSSSGTVFQLSFPCPSTEYSQKRQWE